jgi:hypothetical protein
MHDPDDRDAGFYWISIDSQAPEVAQWHTEWGQWLVTGCLQPLTDALASQVEVLSDMLPPPALPIPADR